ncbi:DUF3090 domain-containing protein [Nocardioides islandensis]|uniref:DUF3090 domain-containing protein n=1 Tax=Nocardioides islandensis TaxID=433663 RepID=A0A930YLS0_9ACTN|nr:DUF3090 domain-containing protein [Nocardioides islandensis]MBF4764895.1 DUF3090 domain-containing protein [Nocardioides islandensis]
MPVIHEFDPPERFVVGTVGEPGQRTFFIQARSGPRMVSVALEKQQVAALAERVDELLDQVLDDGSSRELVPAVAPHDLDDQAPLEQPIEEEFRAGTMTLSWDPGTSRVVIEVFPITDEVVVGEDGDDEDELEIEAYEEPEPQEVLLVRITPGAARAFALRAGRVVEAGRPSCPFCGGPIDPSGHLCVRANGYRRRDA